MIDLLGRLKPRELRAQARHLLNAARVNEPQPGGFGENQCLEFVELQVRDHSRIAAEISKECLLQLGCAGCSIAGPRAGGCRGNRMGVCSNRNRW